MQALEVLGIDPGSVRTGWGIVREQSGCLSLVDCGIIRTTTGKDATGNGLSFSGRLARIFNSLGEIVDKYAPGEAAIEQVFTAQNAASALKLGQARGVAVAVCASRGMEIYDYEPTLVKKSLVGAGRADKEQVAFMVRRLLRAPQSKWALDTSDALAIAICHLTQRRFNMLAKKQVV